MLSMRALRIRSCVHGSLRTNFSRAKKRDRGLNVRPCLYVCGRHCVVCVHMNSYGAYDALRFSIESLAELRRCTVDQILCAR